MWSKRASTLEVKSTRSGDPWPRHLLPLKEAPINCFHVRENPPSRHNVLTPCMRKTKPIIFTLISKFIS